MTAYYNEIDPYAAQWLRNLIAAGHIAPGDVDERSIVDVQPDDVRGYAQCHFFAGIGGWSYALRLAGWEDTRPAWTGSCPCQPFSTAGRGDGAADARHLWPEFARLIGECHPSVVFGEQVASRLGRTWLAAVRADLEGMGYAVGASDLCAAGVGAPHLRQRLWFVADAEGRAPRSGDDAQTGEPDAGTGGGLGNAPLNRERSQQWQPEPGNGREGKTGGSGAWDDLVWLPCRDGKARPTQPGLFPLAHGVPGRVGRLRACGNAIVPQVAAAFVSAYVGRDIVRLEDIL